MVMTMPNLTLNRFVIPFSAEINQALVDTAAQPARVGLAHIQRHGYVTAQEVASLFAVKDRCARSVLNEMLDQGWLEKQGNARQMVYVRGGV